MSDKRLLHFTIGPVQGFVAQARRVRDLWAGSFLLSLLSAHAMKAVLDNGGAIEFPAVHNGKKIQDPLLAAVMGVPLASTPTPEIGSVPNRFKAIIPGCLDPAIIVDAVEQQWRVIAAAVFSEFVAPFIKDDSIKTGDRIRYRERKVLWQQQINGFWNMNWVKGAVDQTDHADGRWLDQRKNWRSRWLAEQRGEKCSLMGDWQELSGFTVYEGEQRQIFWKGLASLTKGGSRNIRSGEYLCAISLVKRLFPTLSEQALNATIGWVPGGDCKRLSNWPSTTYMAALPWLLESYAKPARHTALYRYMQLICEKVESDEDLRLLMSEEAQHFDALIATRPKDLKVESQGNRFYPDDIDGNLLNAHALTNFRSTHLSVAAMTNSAGKDLDSELRETLLNGLRSLHEKISETVIEAEELHKARSYYALLIMDGDRLGALLNQYADHAQRKVSIPLSCFTQQVPNSVAKHHGLTLYSGGDDVLAMLPMTTALACAQQLNTEYRASFAAQGVPQATASAAILYVHHQYPLSNALKIAHQMLDGVAKEENGRDSCVVSVLNSGGDHLQWVNSWDASTDKQVTHRSVAALSTLVDMFKTEQFPRGFPHKLKRQFPYLNTTEAAHSEIDSTLPNIRQPEYLRKLVQAELLMTFDAGERSERQGEISAATDAYLAASCHFCNHTSSAANSGAASVTSQQQINGVQFDAGLIARFLTREDDR